MGQIKHKMGSVGGGVDISHKSKMSGKAKSLMSFPGGMPGPGNYGSMDNKVVGKGMAKYLAGEPVGMGKYKHKGAAQMDPMHNGKPGVQKEDFEQFSAPDSTGPAKTKGDRQAERAAKKANRQKERAKKRIDRNEKKQDRIAKNTQSSSDPAVRASGKARIDRAKKKVKKNRTVAKDYESKLDIKNKAKSESKENSSDAKIVNTKPKFKKIDLVKKGEKDKENAKNKKLVNEKFIGNQEQKALLGKGASKGPAKVDPPIKTEELEAVTVYGKKSKVGANDKKVLDDMASGGRSAKSIKDATEKYGKKQVDVSVRSSNANKGLYNKVRATEK